MFRFIRSIRSHFFHTLFYGSGPDTCTSSSIMDIPDILPDAFANMLSYICTGAVKNLNRDNVFETMSCAAKYDILLLVAQCTQFILSNLNTDNCLEVLDKAVHCTCSELALCIKDECLRLIDESAEAVWQSDRICAIGQDTLEIVLQRDTLAVDEATICSSVEKWAAATCRQRNIEVSSRNRRNVLGKALYLVRFPLLTETQLLDGPAKTGLLLESELWDIFHYKHATVKPGLRFRTEARETIVHVFSPEEDNREFESYISMENLLDPAKGYVNPGDFSLKLQAYMTADLLSATFK
ncbi:BTB/POZ domain-containing protein 6-B-like [Paramacrobiotus metropolitanus]|uniref:BTB/POZ domain-containing protein 6-B-like n=1 Tax=Paramacrobiotus metropolitanus TaxID=2943436 RepID=UPI0024456791|nr:BTB/POZ domain-containing protein 6-B-like [Paramacrobiotus metropolitanus]